MNDFDRLNKLMGFTPTVMTPEDEEITSSGSVLQDTLTKPEVKTTYPEIPEQKPFVPKYGKLPKGHDARFGYIEVGPEGNKHLMLTYNENPNLKGQINKQPIPEPLPPPTMTFPTPMTITGSKKSGGPEKKSSIPPAQSSYGMYAPPVKTSIPITSNVKTRQNAQVWIKNNLDYLPENASLGLILKEMPKEHRKVIKKTVDKAIKEGINKQTIANWLLGRKKK